MSRQELGWQASWGGIVGGGCACTQIAPAQPSWHAAGYQARGLTHRMVLVARRGSGSLLRQR